MNKISIAACLAFILTCAPVWAVKIKTLYEVEMSVASQASEARAEAIRDGFHDVLIKLTGDQDIAKSKLIKSSLDKADYFVQEYSYSSPTVSSATYTLRIKYNQQDVNRLLRKAGAKHWGETRPLVLVWLATINDRHEVDILGVETANDVLQKFKKQGQRFGLPLIFPVMDVADMEKVSSENITAVSLPELRDASKRYEPDVLLVGTISHDDTGYQGRWNLIWKDKTWDWSITGETQEKVIADALDDVSQVLSKRQDAPRNAELSQK